MHLKKEERQRVELFLGHSRIGRNLDLLCECILWVLLILTGLVEGLFGWLSYIPNERKVELKKYILRWLQYAECEVKKIKTRFHNYFHKDPTPL